ncbi:dnaK [Acrasis kona]|uniref:DnaK n=1 Tax=Acrasis kona TaxID=1008807 RepID=A0AAW2ZDA0_9EUKA
MSLKLLRSTFNRNLERVYRRCYSIDQISSQEYLRFQGAGLSEGHTWSTKFPHEKLHMKLPVPGFQKMLHKRFIDPTFIEDDFIDFAKDIYNKVYPMLLDKDINGVAPYLTEQAFQSVFTWMSYMNDQGYSYQYSRLNIIDTKIRSIFVYGLEKGFDETLINVSYTVHDDVLLRLDSMNRTIELAPDARSADLELNLEDVGIKFRNFAFKKSEINGKWLITAIK